jgi:hypothetical protein
MSKYDTFEDISMWREFQVNFVAKLYLLMLNEVLDAQVELVS